MILPFTLQQLRIIKAISTETSFTKAAEILFISQPSLSKQVKTLEGRLGIQLITRNKNKIVLSIDVLGLGSNSKEVNKNIQESTSLISLFNKVKILYFN